MAKTRLFIKFKDDEETFQIFNVDQGSDGSIYISSSGETEDLFHVVSNEPKINIVTLKGPTDHKSKISLHSSGESHLKAGKSPRTAMVKGFPLKGGQGYNVRHLFTVMCAKPFHLPRSPAGNRKSDFIMTSSEPLKPFIIMAWAIPQTEKINIKCGIQTEIDKFMSLDSSSPPKFIKGWMVIPLRQHLLYLIVYNCFNLDWPLENHFFYQDGLFVPMIYAKEKQILVDEEGKRCQNMDIVYLKPEYKLEKKDSTDYLEIDIIMDK